MKEIFLEAAKRIDSELSFYSCNALTNSGTISGLAIAEEITSHYARIICPRGCGSVLINDFETTSQGTRLKPKISREHRVIALLMVGEAWDDLKGEPWIEK